MAQEFEKYDWTGKVVAGHYEISERLADGGHCAVYLGRNLINGGADAAIKVIVETDGDPFENERLQREATVLRLLKGTSATADLIEQRFTDDGRLFLVLDLLDGMSLHSMLERGSKKLDLDEIIPLFTPVVETLGRLHERGILHRNIQPQKLFRSWDPPGLKLIGFGDAIYFKKHAPHRDRFYGPPQYAAPEVWANDPDLDPRADVYSLAVVLFRCMSGRCPFEVDSSIELVGSAAKASRKSLVDLCPELPEALDDWATIALCHDRAGRFETVEAMWRAFLRAAETPLFDRQTPIMPFAAVDSSRSEPGSGRRTG